MGMSSLCLDQHQEMLSLGTVSGIRRDKQCLSSEAATVAGFRYANTMKELMKENLDPHFACKTILRWQWGRHKAMSCTDLGPPYHVYSQTTVVHLQDRTSVATAPNNTE
ncbi:hypothetical protein ElyMa_000318300 [Elysia marginata]|uniref:Uncharacterized protein n=1 Tax=Elysia marginata TaxID=1093978 RepID=A0AAV4F9Y8_9GAST|nr:hypothetical protein ElyMa_000318300 [Elysia marginata]